MYLPMHSKDFGLFLLFNPKDPGGLELFLVEILELKEWSQNLRHSMNFKKYSLGHLAAQQVVSLWLFFHMNICVVCSTKRCNWVKISEAYFRVMFSNRGNRFGLFTTSSCSLLALFESQLSNSSGSVWPQYRAKLCSGQNGRWYSGKNPRESCLLAPALPWIH